ncbi:MAG TPA: hypothetical protein VN040_11550 [Pseudosphingobacterium sp.]|nr:hypothetical protein [Pseudosphingobacterium sp.]
MSVETATGYQHSQRQTWPHFAFVGARYRGICTGGHRPQTIEFEARYS